MHKQGLNWKFIIRITGLVLVIESLFMFASSAIAWHFDGTDFFSLIVSAVITLVCGTAMSLYSGFKRVILIGKRESYLSVAMIWIFFALFGALPFFISREIPTFTDAFFESVSGITTTGSTILTDIDSISKGLLFWRSLMQWLGGMGIVVFSLALLPIIGEASKLFDAETSGLTHDKFRPRVTQMATRLWAIYLTLTCLTAGLLYWGPMNWYDAVCHSFTTVSTGGFSTHQESIAYWDSIYIEAVVIVFMIAGAINFSLYYFLINGQFRKFFKDEELRWFLLIILIASVLVTVGIMLYHGHSVVKSFRFSLFQVISVVSTSGFATADFSSWGSFALFIFIVLMVVCGCAGSTSGGLKVVRAVVLSKNTFCEFRRLLHPRAIIPVRLNGNALAFSTVQRLLAFTFLYITIIFTSWGILTLFGMPFDEALSASVSAISNVGPGFGSINTTYAAVPIAAKWYLSFLMVTGRLELFTILILLTPGFWKK